MAQVVGAVAAAAVLHVVASGKADSRWPTVSLRNGYARHSPGGYNLVSALVIEVVLTAFLLYLLRFDEGNAAFGFAAIAIGLALHAHSFHLDFGHQYVLSLRVRLVRLLSSAGRRCSSSGCSGSRHWWAA